MRTVLSSLTLAACLAPAALAQSTNCTQLSRLDARTAYAGVWGYTAPDLREYAIVGERTGTMIVDCTDPRNPIEVGYITATSSTWREMTSIGPIVYSCSENHAGLRLIDLTNPATPVDLGLRFQTNWNSTHSISSDPGTQRVYANGTGGGMRILDASVDPRNPTLLSTYTASYVHDSYWRRGKGYLAHINAGTVRIVDATQLTLPQISQTTTPGRFTHNAWVTEDDRLLLTTDENSTGFLQSYDISTPATPVIRGSYTVTGSIVHNVFGIGRVAYVSWYTAGLEVIDLADPMNLKRVANYDTSTSMSGYNGAWGAYPWTDNGVVYVSDIQNGLYCVQVDVGHINRYGTGTAGANGRPRMSAEGGAIEVGQSALRFEMTNLPASAPVLLVLSGAQGTGSFLGANIHVDLASLLIVTGRADANGKLSLPFPMPANPSLAMVRIYAQLFSVEGAGLVSSRGMWFGIGPG